jgi:hypothetical protein
MQTMLVSKDTEISSRLKHQWFFKNLNRRNGIAFYSLTGRAGGLLNYINYLKHQAAT